MSPSEPKIWAPVTKGLVLGTTFCVSRLQPSKGYHFRVVAINKIGESQPGYESELIEATGKIYIYIPTRKDAYIGTQIRKKYKLIVSCY